MWRITLIGALAVMASACLGSDFADSVEGTWQMTSGSVAGEEIPILDSHPITITLDGGQVSGTASCNGYGGTYELDREAITFGTLAMTEMACSPEETMQAEALFAEGLTLVSTVSLDGELTLSGDGTEMRFEELEPVPEAELTNTVWVLDGMLFGGTVASPVADTRASIEFFTDGSVLGDTGCRLFSGHYTVSGAEVVVTELAADGHECQPALADQDRMFLTVVEDGFRVEIEGDRLTVWKIPDDEGLSFFGER